MTPFPMLQDWNSTTRLGVILRNTEASKRERERAKVVVIRLYGERHMVRPSHSTYDVTDFHVPYPAFVHLFMIQLGYFCVRLYVWYQHTLEQLYGWVWVWHFNILEQPYGWVWVWHFTYIYRLTDFIYGDVVGDILWSNPPCFDLLVSSIQRNPFVLPCPSSNKIAYPLSCTLLIWKYR